jgi:hypothetical protein
MGHRQPGREALNPTGKQTKASGVGSLLALLEEELKPEADTQYRTAGNGYLANGFTQTGGCQSSGGLTEVADAGNEQSLGATHLVRISREF